MSIHLVGGGSAEDYDGEVYREFLVEAGAHASAGGREKARVAVLIVAFDTESGSAYASSLSALLASVADCEPVATAIIEGELFTSEVLLGIDGLLIAGGLTPAYLDAVTPIVEDIRLLVGNDLPYLGFSAGAAIAADTAIIGGWRIGDIPVSSPETGEDLDEVTVTSGLGLVDLAIEAHAAQWGTLARLIAATEAGLVDGGIAIDEFTVLIVGDETLRVIGRGSIWQVSAHEDGVLVSTLGA